MSISYISCLHTLSRFLAALIILAFSTDTKYKEKHSDSIFFSNVEIWEGIFVLHNCELDKRRIMYYSTVFGTNLSENQVNFNIFHDSFVFIQKFQLE